MGYVFEDETTGAAGKKRNMATSSRQRQHEDDVRESARDAAEHIVAVSET